MLECTNTKTPLLEAPLTTETPNLKATLNENAIDEFPDLKYKQGFEFGRRRNETDWFIGYGALDHDDAVEIATACHELQIKNPTLVTAKPIEYLTELAEKGMLYYVQKTEEIKDQETGDFKRFDKTKHKIVGCGYFTPLGEIEFEGRKEKVIKYGGACSEGGEQLIREKEKSDRRIKPQGHELEKRTGDVDRRTDQSSGLFYAMMHMAGIRALKENGVLQRCSLITHTSELHGSILAQYGFIDETNLEDIATNSFIRKLSKLEEKYKEIMLAFAQYLGEMDMIPATLSYTELESKFINFLTTKKSKQENEINESLKLIKKFCSDFIAGCKYLYKGEPASSNLEDPTHKDREKFLLVHYSVRLAIDGIVDHCVDKQVETI